VIGGVGVSANGAMSNGPITRVSRRASTGMLLLAVSVCLAVPLYAAVTARGNPLNVGGIAVAALPGFVIGVISVLGGWKSRAAVRRLRLLGVEPVRSSAQTLGFTGVLLTMLLIAASFFVAQMPDSDLPVALVSGFTVGASLTEGLLMRALETACQRELDTGVLGEPRV
jgi:hypothetical protein